MSVNKEKLHDITKAFDSNGRFNAAEASKGLAHFQKQKDAGHWDTKNGTVSVSPKSKGVEHVTIEFDRFETDPTVHAAEPTS